MLGTLSCGAVMAALVLAKLSSEPPASAVDAIFKQYNHADSPGCAVAVEHEGQIVYEKGFGQANLEAGVPITPQTIFHVASISKQVTAFAIQLLVDEGKIKLDDDVHKYLPELHDFGQLITVANLLHHTSGLRDQWDLVSLGGWRMEDVITQDDLLGLLFKQRELNFAPGSAFLYCNSGYTLLATIVERVSGQPMPDFCRERLFKPLGMAHTHFHDDVMEIVPGRAESYEKREAGGFQKQVLSYSNVGATSLFTTVEDFVLWNENLFTGKVGGTALIARMKATFPLTNGTPNHYGCGLVEGTYRGLPVIEHTGADAGFRTDSLLFPDEKVSVLCFSNQAEADVAALTRKVADLYFKDKMQAVRPPAKPVKVSLGLLARYAGTYEFDAGRVFTLDVRDGVLRATRPGGEAVEMKATADDRFDLSGVGRWRFSPTADGSYKATLIAADGSTVGTRLALSPLHPADFAGDYYSEELDQLFHVKQSGDGLQLGWVKNIWDLEPYGNDTFGASWRVVRFQRRAGKVIGFTVSTGRSYNIAFHRIDLH